MKFDMHDVYDRKKGMRGVHHHFSCVLYQKLLPVNLMLLLNCLMMSLMMMEKLCVGLENVEKLKNFSNYFTRVLCAVCDVTICFGCYFLLCFN